MPISYSANQYGPAYEFGVWLREHSGEILEALQSPKVWLLVVAGLFVIFLILAGVIRAAARAYYFLRLSLEIRAGTITVGYRRTKPLDVILDPPLRLSFPDRCMHTQVVAPTRQGKTSLMSSWLHQDLVEGQTAMVNEMTGDLCGKACEAAQDVGASVSHLDPTKADTLKWNPLYARNWQELESVAERTVAAFEVVGASTNPYYLTVNHVVLRRMIYAAWAFANSVGHQPDFLLVKRFLADEEYLRYALQIVQDSAGRPRVDFDGLDPTTRHWFAERYFRWNRDERENNTNGLYLTLDELLARGEVAEALRAAPGEPRLDLRHALTQGGLIACSVREEKTGAVPSLLLTTLMQQHIQSVTLNRGGINSPLVLYLDEFSSLVGGPDTRAADSFGRWLPKVGKYGVAVVLGYQGFGMLQPSLQDVVSQNASNKFVSGRLAVEEAYEIQRMLGTKQKQVEEVRKSASALFGPGQISTTRRTVEVPRYSIEEIRRLSRGDWFFIGTKKGNLQDPEIMKAK